MKNEDPKYRVVSGSHDIHECWKPHYHAETFRQESADLLAKRLSQKVVPLCAFGGVSYSPHTLAAVGGTYVICPDCGKHDQCGYSDGEYGPNPKSCAGCGRRFDYSDYFQPLEGCRVSRTDMLIDPKRNPYVAVTELLAAANKGQFPSSRIEHAITVLTFENLLSSAAHVPLNLRKSCGLTYLRDGAFWFSSWIQTDIGQWQLGELGREMLKMRGYAPTAELAHRIEELAELDIRLLQAEALQAHYHREKRGH